MTTAAIAILALSVVFLALIEPKKSEKSQYMRFAARNYAHRGLYEKDQSVPENSLAAFSLAVEAGYGIELDIRLTRDGKMVVFHDSDLKRACSSDITVENSSYEELSSYRLFGTNETIPLLSDVLMTVNGKVPLIIEFKTADNISELCNAAWEIISVYTGDFCIESFDPRVVAWFYRHHANVYRGQLTASYKALAKNSKLNAFIVSRVLSNIIARPHFIAHSMERKSFPVRLCEWLGARKIVWAVGDSASGEKYETENDCVIFEHYRPRPKYYKEF